MTSKRERELSGEVTKFQKLAADNVNIHFLYEQAQAENEVLEAKINSANKILEEGCVDQDGCCPYTDDGVCYDDDDCVLARLRVVLQGKEGDKK